MADVKEEENDVGRATFDELPSPYLKPYLHEDKSLDKHYGIRTQDGNFMIGNAYVTMIKRVT
jgi:hypothetical protein